jgi:hypothetical protein
VQSRLAFRAPKAYSQTQAYFAAPSPKPSPKLSPKPSTRLGHCAFAFAVTSPKPTSLRLRLRLRCAFAPTPTSMCDEATGMKLHSKVRWGDTDEVQQLLQTEGAVNYKVRWGNLCAGDVVGPTA